MTNGRTSCSIRPGFLPASAVRLPTSLERRSKIRRSRKKIIKLWQLYSLPSVRPSAATAAEEAKERKKERKKKKN
jgi:hypothetical protein